MLAIGFLRHVPAYIGPMTVQWVRKGNAPGAVSTGLVDRDGDGEADADPLVRQVQEVWDEWCTASDWGKGTEDREKESRVRFLRDGNVILRLGPGGRDRDFLPWTRFVEPEQIRSPGGRLPRSPDTIPTSSTGPGASARSSAMPRPCWPYWLADPDGGGGSRRGRARAQNIIRLKANVDRTIKVGIPDFFPLEQPLQEALGILSNCGATAREQSGVAWIQKYATPPPTRSATSCVRDPKHTRSRRGRATRTSRRLLGPPLHRQAARHDARHPRGPEQGVRGRPHFAGRAQLHAGGRGHHARGRQNLGPRELVRFGRRQLRGGAGRGRRVRPARHRSPEPADRLHRGARHPRDRTRRSLGPAARRHVAARSSRSSPPSPSSWPTRRSRSARCCPSTTRTWPTRPNRSRSAAATRRWFAANIIAWRKGFGDGAGRPRTLGKSPAARIRRPAPPGSAGGDGSSPNEPADDIFGTAAERAGPHKYSSTHIEFAGEAKARLLDLARRVRDEDLAEDGREDEPHVTARYGLSIDDAAAVVPIVQDFGPVKFRLGRVSLFPATDKRPCDVLKVDVESADLHELNAVLAELPHVDTQAGYKPHATIAYLKPGLGAIYAALLDAARPRCGGDPARVLGPQPRPDRDPARRARARRVGARAKCGRGRAGAGSRSRAGGSCRLRPRTPARNRPGSHAPRTRADRRSRPAGPSGAGETRSRPSTSAHDRERATTPEAPRPPPPSSRTSRAGAGSSRRSRWRPNSPRPSAGSTSPTAGRPTCSTSRTSTATA